MSKKTNTDLRSPLARARDEWLESDEGKRCRQGKAYGPYLSNRLQAAFVAGWNAAAEATGKALK